MVQGLIGKKLGMTQVFDDEGRVIPVTVLKAGPCVVVQKKTMASDGYQAVQLGLVEERPARANKPLAGHFEKAGVAAARRLREFGFTEGEEEEIAVGDQVLVQDVFAPDDRVDILGRTIGRGFQGVIKRHGFGGGRATHGSMFHRAPGSIGQSASPSRVLKGMRGPGHMGNRRNTVKNLKVVRVDTDRNLLLVKGSVPGSRGNYVQICRSSGRNNGQG
jgi:large subunit ribosomal protein L3